jgi:hypothetical protein
VHPGHAAQCQASANQTPAAATACHRSRPCPCHNKPLQGVLNAQGCQVVARLCFFVYTPALTFSKLVQAISVSSIAHLWPLLLNMTVRWVLLRPRCESCGRGCGVCFGGCCVLWAERLPAACRRHPANLHPVGTTCRPGCPTALPPHPAAS